MSTATQHQWTIVAASGDGDVTELRENPHNPLHQLLTAAVRELYGQHAAVGEYDLVINGVIQTDLDLSLEHAGLHDEAEVVVQPKNVSRG